MTRALVSVCMALKFSAFKPMWDARKSDPANLFSAAEENTFALAEPETDPTGSISDAITSGFARLAQMFGRAPEPKPEPKTGEKPGAPANDNIDIAAFTRAIGEQVGAAIKPVAESTTALRAELDALKQKLAGTPADNFTRPPATGGTGTVVTDC